MVILCFDCFIVLCFTKALFIISFNCYVKDFINANNSKFTTKGGLLF